MENFVDLIPVAILAGVLAIGWVLLRVVFKLTQTLFRIGCAVIVLIVLAGAALVYLL